MGSEEGGREEGRGMRERERAGVGSVRKRRVMGREVLDDVFWPGGVAKRFLFIGSLLLLLLGNLRLLPLDSLLLLRLGNLLLLLLGMLPCYFLAGRLLLGLVGCREANRLICRPQRGTRLCSSFELSLYPCYLHMRQPSGRQVV